MKAVFEVKRINYRIKLKVLLRKTILVVICPDVLKDGLSKDVKDKFWNKI